MSRSELIKTLGDARAARGELTGWATTRRNLRLHDAIAKKYHSAPVTMHEVPPCDVSSYISSIDRSISCSREALPVAPAQTPVGQTHTRTRMPDAVALQMIVRRFPYRAEVTEFYITGHPLHAMDSLAKELHGDITTPVGDERGLFVLIGAAGPRVASCGIGGSHISCLMRNTVPGSMISLHIVSSIVMSNGRYRRFQPIIQYSVSDQRSTALYQRLKLSWRS